VFRRTGPLLLTLVFVAMLAGGATAATQSPTFVRTDYPQLGTSQVVADFNRDGKPDLAGTGAQSAAVVLANGPGTFGPRVEYPVARQAQDVAAGDFNGDTNPDLVVTLNDPQLGLALLTGTGTGTFNAPAYFPNNSGFDSPAAADLDSDGRKDLAIAGDSSRVYRLYGLGNGTFVQQPTITLTADTLGVDATDIDVADFNHDSIQDLVVAIALNGSRTAILLGNADGTFRPPLILTDPNLNVPPYQAWPTTTGTVSRTLRSASPTGTRG
jgi:FG-GAP-like repeat